MPCSKDTELERVFQFYRGYWARNPEANGMPEEQQEQEADGEASEEEEVENDECVEDEYMERRRMRWMTKTWL